MKNEPLISVIIPAYNVEKYLRETVISVLNQTYRNLEIIIVDDGSTDNTPRICDEAKEKDSRVKVIRKKNGGSSSARNAGLNIATGDYVGFVDGDDRIHTEMFDSLLKAIKKSGAYISRCGIKKVHFTEDITAYDGKNEDFSVIEYEDALRSVWDNGFMCNKLFDTALFNGKHSVRFNENIWYVEDEPVLAECILHSKKGIAEVKTDLYYYTNNPNSISHVPFSLKKLSCLIGFRHMCDLIHNNEPQLSDYFDSKYYSICVGYLTNRTVRKSSEHRKTISNELRANIKEIVQLKNMTFKFKVAAVMFAVLG